jgi:hypothetical protein
MDASGLHFFAGTGPVPSLPLGRYLPPVPAGMASAWLSERLPPGSWVLDPLGSSPAQVLEAARAGYRVLVACNNPILSFFIETLASAPKTADFQAALAELAVAKRGDERLEKHIRHLYLTECDACGEAVQVEAFLWHKGEGQPFARVYNCPKCGESGERPVVQKDLERLAGMGGDKLQRARALQRVILNEDEYRADVEEALESYVPRSLYVLFTLLNKAEGLGLPPERLRLIQALLLSIFDVGSTLWPYPGGRSRPKQLTVPPTFRENNLWSALEEAAGAWSSASSGKRIPVTRWPEQPPREGGICLFRGRVKTLMPLPPELGPQAVLTAFPRPNQAFWTLSVLWAGWLWGAEAALPLRNILDRRRYDWNWHSQAVHSALVAVAGSLPPETPFFGLLPEMVPGFLSAVIVAARAAGLNLNGLALRNDQDLAQVLWQPGNISALRTGEVSPRQSETALRQGESVSRLSEPSVPPSSGQLEQAARAAIRANLIARNEPALYPVVYAAGLVALMEAGAVGKPGSTIPDDLLGRIQAILARTFADRSFMRLFGGPAEEERGWWWLTSPAGEGSLLPLTDRVEIETVRFLQKHPTCNIEELEQALCAQFTGLQTPAGELMRACLESYAEPVLPPAGNAGPALYRLRAGDSAAARKADLQEMREELTETGRRLGYSVMEQELGPGMPALLWEENGEGWAFFRMASSIVSRFVLGPELKPGLRGVIILPGSRAKLLSYKLRRDPRLAERISGKEGGAAHAGGIHWRFLKFRHLREIVQRTGLTRDEWESLLEEDPLTDEATQIPLFL